MKKPAILIVAVACLAALAWWLIFANGAKEPSPFLGYVEAETALVAPKRGGRVVELAVAKGELVAAGARLFALDADEETAAVAEAEARLKQARAQLEDLRAAGQRPEEIEAMEARRRQALAALSRSRPELERQERLFAQNVVAAADLERARAAFERDKAALAEVEQEILAARLPGRDARIDAAAAEVEALAAALARARAALSERVVMAPLGGRAVEVFFRVGELAAAGQPVVEILPSENVVARFFVSEPGVAGLEYGQGVTIFCDGCPEGGIEAAISFIADEAEFTPPVIFSRQERAKLVFRVEARPTEPTSLLKPGLPIEARVR